MASSAKQLRSPSTPTHADVVDAPPGYGEGQEKKNAVVDMAQRDAALLQAGLIRKRMP
jgi:hypothetical protein